VTAMDITIHASFLPHDDADNHRYGIRDGAFRDLAGNLIRIQELR
jgi:hypothetical protein